MKVAQPLLLAAHRAAGLAGKRFIEATVGELDSALLTAIRATNQVR